MDKAQSPFYQVSTDGPELLPVTIPRDATSFKANGVQYFIETFTPVSVRFKRLTQFEIEAGFGTTLYALMQRIEEAKNANNKGRPGDVGHLLGNLQQLIVNVEQNVEFYQRVCTLFINFEGENRRVWNEDLAQKKIADWEAEGIEHGFFIRTGADGSPTLKRCLIEASRILLEGPGPLTTEEPTFKKPSGK